MLLANFARNVVGTTRPVSEDALPGPPLHALQRCPRSQQSPKKKILAPQRMAAHLRQPLHNLSIDLEQVFCERTISSRPFQASFSLSHQSKTAVKMESTAPCEAFAQNFQLIPVLAPLKFRGVRAQSCPTNNIRISEAQTHRKLPLRVAALCAFSDDDGQTRSLPTSSTRLHTPQHTNNKKPALVSSSTSTTTAQSHFHFNSSKKEVIASKIQPSNFLSNIVSLFPTSPFTATTIISYFPNLEHSPTLHSARPRQPDGRDIGYHSLHSYRYPPASGAPGPSPSTFPSLRTPRDR